MTTPTPPEPTDGDRFWAAYLAVQTAGSITQSSIRTWTQFWWRWLTTGSTDPVAAIVITVTVRNKQGDAISTQTLQGGNMATSMTMDDTITVAASETDDHGDPVTSDQLALTDNTSPPLMTWTQSGNTWTGVPQGVGNGSASVADPSASNLSAATVDYSIGAGAPSQIAVTTTVNTGANAAPPAAPAS